LNPAAGKPPILVTTADVANYVGIPLSKLMYLLHVVPRMNRYRAFELQRKSGTPRTIEAPIKPLKAVQSALAVAFQAYYRPRAAVHGYIPGKSILSNARVHRRQLWVLRIDLSDFFPSVNFGRVRGLFLKPPFSFSDKVATVLAQICCHRNQLPQGAPTSPIISNFVCRGLDAELGRLATSERLYYTRYCDDLVFSTNRSSIPSNIAMRDEKTGAVRAGSALIEIVERHGFHINDSKTLLRKRTQRQMVTGLVTNEFVNIPRDYIRSIRSALHIWKRYGEPAAVERLNYYRPINRPPTLPVDIRLTLRGRIQYVGAIKGWNSSVYQSLAARLQLLDPTFTPTVKAPPPTLLRVLAEGRTDYTHIKSAFKAFQGNREFLDLDLVLEVAREEKGGHDVLLKTCHALARAPQNPPVVCVFDRDVSQIVPQVTTPEMEFRAWGNDVFSLAIPYPPHRAASEPLCIEMLYDDDVLCRRDSNGRRLFLGSEFDPATGKHRTEPLYSRTDALIRDDQVFDMEGRKVSLSKSAFADAIAHSKPPFREISFEGFRPLFGALRAIRTYRLVTQND
jgi:RNA-directed DNA polymerase